MPPTIRARAVYVVERRRATVLSSRRSFSAPKIGMFERGVLASIFRRPVVWNQNITIPKRAFGAPKHGPFHRASSTSGYSPPKTVTIPERLLVYHAGTGKIVFIGLMKINTIFLFSFSCLVLAPSYYLAPDWPNWTVLAAIITGALPMIFVTYTTRPFVNHLSIKLPGFARRSREHLMQWAQQVPLNTEIEMTTMRFSGRPRVSRMLLSDLRETKVRFGVENLANVSKSPISSNSSRLWWMGKEPDVFYAAPAHTQGRKSTPWQVGAWQREVWQHVLDQIRKQ